VQGKTVTQLCPCHPAIEQAVIAAVWQVQTSPASRRQLVATDDVIGLVHAALHLARDCKAITWSRKGSRPGRMADYAPTSFDANRYH